MSDIYMSYIDKFLMHRSYIDKCLIHWSYRDHTPATTSRLLCGWSDGNVVPSNGGLMVLREHHLPEKPRYIRLKASSDMCLSRRERELFHLH
jgi:hypothetical protein